MLRSMVLHTDLLSKLPAQFACLDVDIVCKGSSFRRQVQLFLRTFERYLELF